MKSNVFPVNSAHIVKAPTLAVNTPNGCSFEVVADMGAEANVISDILVKQLTLNDFLLAVKGNV